MSNGINRGKATAIEGEGELQIPIILPQIQAVHLGFCQGTSIATLDSFPAQHSQPAWTLGELKLLSWIQRQWYEIYCFQLSMTAYPWLSRSACIIPFKMWRTVLMFILPTFSSLGPKLLYSKYEKDTLRATFVLEEILIINTNLSESFKHRIMFTGRLVLFKWQVAHYFLRSFIWLWHIVICLFKKCVHLCPVNQKCRTD